MSLGIYSVHIWHKLCVWVRDLHVPLCTLATGRGVHISSTGKGHTKHKAKKQNINKEDKFLVCLCRGDSHARAPSSLPSSSSLHLPLPSRQQGAKQAERREADSPADSPYCPRTTQEDAADDPLDLHTAALFLVINIAVAADGKPKMHL